MKSIYLENNIVLKYNWDFVNLVVGLLVVLKKSYWAKNFNEVSVTYSRTCSLAQLHGSSEGFATLFMAIYHPHLSQVQPKKDSKGRPWGCSITKHWYKTRCIILNFFLEMHLRGHWISGFWIFPILLPL